MIDRIPLNTVSRVGFGCYRVARGVAEHHAALTHALSLGCTLIDTASNYADGRSEELVGEVLSSNPHYPAFVVTKAGYITPSTEELLGTSGVAAEKMHPISTESKYSIDPDVLRIQIDLSLKRLRRPWLDALLLHNPEHYFDCEGVDKSEQDYYARLQKAFEFLEECVAVGKLRYYGISSNTLAFSVDYKTRTHLDRLLTAAKAISSSHHFKIVEFPLNLVETQALVPQPSGHSLIDDIRANGLVSIANRPLNSQRGNEVIRLATYEDEAKELNPSEALGAYERCIELIGNKLEGDHLRHNVMDFAVMKFLRDNWHGVEHPDTVDLIFGRHFYPFVEHLWNGNVPEKAKSSFAALHRYAKLYAKQRLSKQGQLIRAELVEAGVIADDDSRSLAAIACDFCLRSGVDHVVVGMRTVRYIDSLRQLI